MFDAKLAAVDKHRDLILKTQDYIWKNPEDGGDLRKPRL